jgi:fructooligosaccharide transport system substrate-binding protein
MKISRSLLGVMAAFMTLYGGAAAQAQGPVKLKVLIGNWAPPALTPALKTFTKESGIEVNAEDLPFRDLLKKIEISAKAEAGDIDVIFVDAPLTPSYAERGLLIPLNDYFADLKPEQLWASAAVNSATWKGKIWAPPLNNSSQVLYYNKDLLDKAGIPYPSASLDKRMTWTEVVDNARKIAKPETGQWGLMFDQVSRYYQLQVLPESLGGGPGLSKDGLSVAGQLTNDGWIKGLTFYGDLFNKWKISPKGVSPAETVSMFASGKVAYFVGLDARAVDFDKAGVKYGFVPHPYFAGGKPATPTNSWHIGVWKHTKYPKEAAQLVRFLTTNPKIAIETLDIDGRLPSHTAALRYIAEQQKFTNSVKRLAALEATNTGVVRARTPAYLEFEELVNNAMEDIRNGGDPKSVLSETEARITSALRRYR